MKFYEWFLAQHDRGDIVGWVSRWFLGGRGRRPKDCILVQDFIDIAERKAPKAQKEAVLAALVTASTEWDLGGELVKELDDCPVDCPIDESVETSVEDHIEEPVEVSDGDVFSVRPTIARLSKVVRGSHEGGELEAEEEIQVSKFKGPVATVGLRQRLTTSYGGDWVQLGVMLSLPCYPEEIDKAFDFADEWITKKIREEVNKFKGGSLQDGHEDAVCVKSDGSIDEETDHGDVLDDDDVEDTESAVSEEESETDGGKFELESESENSDDENDFGF